MAKYWMTFFVFSVLPAPDSPLVKKRRQTKRNGIGRGEKIEQEREKGILREHI